MAVKLFAYLFCAFNAFVFTASMENNESQLEVDPVYMTVSSLYRLPKYGSSLIDRELQLHWDPQVFTKIALYTSEPKNESDAVLEVNSEDYPEGFFQSNISLGTPVFPSGWDKNSRELPVPGDHCVDFWLGAFQDGSLVHLHCFHIHPTWMYDNRLSIGSLSLTSLFIPGTHNSGCYMRGNSLSQADTTGRFLLTQDQDIWSQLVYGVRYLDLRVGIYPMRQSNGSEQLDNENNFWINHDLIKLHPLVPELRDIRRFLESAPKEIVILDFHRFPVGFYGRHHRHHRFVKLLERELGDFAIPFTGEFPTLDKLWEENRTLILSYGNKEIVAENDWLWPSIKHVWGNQQNISGLYEFLDERMRKPKLRDADNGLWAAMGQLTPTPLEILFNPHGSLRNMANSMNQNLTSWIQEEWWDKANIVTSDFFLGNNLINIAIAANIYKGNLNKRYVVSEDSEEM